MLSSRHRGSRRPEFLSQAGAPGAVARATFPTASEKAVRPHTPIAHPLQQEPEEEPAQEEPQEQGPPIEAVIAEQVAAEVAAVEERLQAELGSRLGAAVDQLRATSERLASEARADALEVGFLIARRILESELRASPEPLVSLVRSTIRRLGEARKLLVKLSPADAEAVSAVLAARGPGAVSTVATAQIEVVADPSLGRGDCLVEGDVGSVDGRVATRIEELRRALVDEPIEEGT